jgi:hypothetical protein
MVCKDALIPRKTGYPFINADELIHAALAGVLLEIILSSALIIRQRCGFCVF